MRRLVALALLAASSWAAAQAVPTGLWKTIDDETKEAKSLVRIVEAGGIVSGKVVEIFDPARKAAVCEKCDDARKGQPIVGMTIIEGVRKNADEAYWDGGTILDPNNGKVYRVRLTPQEGGKQLQVRGFFGPFYRSQVWLRVE